MENIIVAFPSQEGQVRVRRLLESGGCRAAVCCASGAEALRAARKLERPIVLCAFRLRDMTAGELAADLRDCAAVLVISTAANLDFCQGENLYKLVSPASRADFFATLDLLRSAVPIRSAPPRREEEQRLIQTAKALLMEVNRMSESEAHRFLQKRSMDRGWKLTETARWVMETYRKL